MLNGEDPDRAFEPDDRDSGEAVVPLLPRLRLVEEGWVLGRLSEVEYASFGGNGADKALTHFEPRHVDGLFAEAVSGEQLEIVVAEQVDRADVAGHLLRDEVDNLVELGLGRAAARHDRVEAGQDLASGGGGTERHKRPAIRCAAAMSRLRSNMGGGRTQRYQPATDIHLASLFIRSRISPGSASSK